MLLSEREMGLSDEHTGIVELPADALVGAPVAAVLGLDDPLFDVTITPNRGDCLGVRGIARDLAAAGLGTLKPLPPPAAPGSFDSPIAVILDFDRDTATACPYFAGRLIRGVVNRDSPRWLQDRLLGVGLRPISALVDITNYLTLDVCRPLHAFDADRLAGDLRVRLARDGERLAGLDGKDYALAPGMTVIVDDRGPQALGGVIGGEATACTAATTSVFLESALFDPVRTAVTGRSLGILSDARFRFERGIDPGFVIDGLEMATRLVLDICGGEASAIVVAGADPDRRSAVRFRPDRVASLTGADVAAEESADILRRLGFSIERGETGWLVAPPSWRGDIAGEACLIEEVVRIAGYDRIPVTPLGRDRSLAEPVLTPAQRRHALARRTLAARGMMEAVTFSFLAPQAARAFGGGGADLSAGQSDQLRSGGDAAVAAAEPDRRRRPQRRPRPARRRLVRGRPAVPLRPTGGSVDRRRRHPRRPRDPPPLGGSRPCRRRLRCQGRRPGAARRPRRADGEAAARDGCRAIVVSSRPLGGAPPRPAAVARRLRRDSPGGPRSVRRQKPAGRLRGLLRCGPLRAHRRYRAAAGCAFATSSRSNATSPSSSTPTYRPPPFSTPPAVPSRC